MKKTIALFLAIFLIAGLAAIPVSAAPDGPKYGDVKKVNDSDINMSNADKDAAFNTATAIALTTTSTGDDTVATGTVYLVWSDTSYYAYFEINDKTPVSDPDKPAAQQPWVTDSVEYFIDEVNGGEFCEQFRVDRDGVPSYYPQGGAWPNDMMIGVTDISGLDPVPANYMSWSVKTDGDKYYVKMKISKLGNMKAKDVGVNFQINDITEVGGACTNTWPANYTGSSWNSDVFGYVTLVNDPAVVAAAAPAATEPVQEAAPAAVVDTPAVVVAPAPAAAAKTGDCGMILALLALAASAVTITAINSRKSKGNI